VKKYHPDHYQDHPLADLAKEKMQEINAAYDQLTSGSTQTGSGPSSYHSTGQTSQQQSAQQQCNNGSNNSNSSGSNSSVPMATRAPTTASQW
jgi:curved DNA-binding protein CbpA